MRKLAVFDAKSYDEESFNRINNEEIFKSINSKNNDVYDITYFKDSLSADNVILCFGFDAVCCFVNDKIDKEVLECLNEYGINILALRCSGYDNVSLIDAYKKVHIVRVPAYAPEAIAEHVFALILTLNRKIHKAYNRTRDYNFSISNLTGFNLKDKTIGVVGTGRIGSQVATIAKGFGMKVLAYDLYRNDSLDIDYVSLEELYQKSDIITLHIPLTGDSYYLIDRDALAMMKNGVMIINTSRGALINSNDLLKYIKNGKVSAVGLDVYEEEANIFFEDFSQDSSKIIDNETLTILLALPNVIVTSHQAYLTREALDEIARVTFLNLNQYFHNELMVNELCYKCKMHPSKCFNNRTKRCW